MTSRGSRPDLPAAVHPYEAEIEREREGSDEAVCLVLLGRVLTPVGWLEPGCHRDPVWAVRESSPITGRSGEVPT
jgi:hypothetical protein